MVAWVVPLTVPLDSSLGGPKNRPGDGYDGPSGGRLDSPLETSLDGPTAVPLRQSFGTSLGCRPKRLRFSLQHALDEPSDSRLDSPLTFSPSTNVLESGVSVPRRDRKRRARWPPEGGAERDRRNAPETLEGPGDGPGDGLEGDPKNGLSAAPEAAPETVPLRPSTVRETVRETAPLRSLDGLSTAPETASETGHRWSWRRSRRRPKRWS